MNQQDWAKFKPVAMEYLEKYGAFIKEEELKIFNEAIEKNKYSQDDKDE